MRLRLRFLLERLIGRWHAMRIQCEFSLLDLPNELIVLILEQVESLAVLRSLACTSRRINDLAEPLLYRRMVIRDLPGARNVLQAFDNRQQRAQHVQILDVPCKPRVGPEISALGTLFCRALNIQQLLFESPECNSGNFEPSDEWEEMTDHLFYPFQLALPWKGPELSKRPLQKLTKLTLNINGGASPYWSFDTRSIHILCHPTLLDLTVSCMNINQSLSVGADFIGKTVLKRLTLVECNITITGLTNLLKVPKALEKLSLGENCHNVEEFFTYQIDPNSNHLFERRPGATIQALALQKNSLQELTYVTTSRHHQAQPVFYLTRNAPPVHGAFSDFPHLTKVALHGQCPNFERAVLSSNPPPSLRQLEFRTDLEGCLIVPTEFRDDASTPTPFLRVPSASIPQTLKRLLITIDTAIHPNGVFLSQHAKEKMIDAYRYCEKLGITMNVFHRQLTSHIPPYLYLEPLPRTQLIYAGGHHFMGNFADEITNSIHDDDMNEDETDDDDSSDEEWTP